MLKASLLLALSVTASEALCGRPAGTCVAVQPSSLGWSWCLQVELMIWVGRQAQQFEQMRVCCAVMMSLAQ